MKRRTGFKSWKMWVGGVLAAALLVGGGLMGAVETAEAAPPAAAEGASLLEKAYQRLLWALEGQAMSLEMAADVADRVQERIDDLAEAGEDVTALEDALAAYQAAIAEAQGYHDQAAAVLELHAGFNENGQVIDREQARETIRQAGRLLRDAGHALHQGTIALRRAIADWRREHRAR